MPVVDVLYEYGIVPFLTLRDVLSVTVWLESLLRSCLATEDAVDSFCYESLLLSTPCAVDGLLVGIYPWMAGYCSILLGLMLWSGFCYYFLSEFCEEVDVLVVDVTTPGLSCDLLLSDHVVASTLSGYCR